MAVVIYRKVCLYLRRDNLLVEHPVALKKRHNSLTDWLTTIEQGGCECLSDVLSRMMCNLSGIWPGGFAGPLWYGVWPSGGRQYAPESRSCARQPVCS